MLGHPHSGALGSRGSKSEGKPHEGTKGLPSQGAPFLLGSNQMTALEFISSIVSALAWPAAVCVFVFVFRRQLGGLINRLSSLKSPSGWQLDFDAEIMAIEVKTAALPPPSSEVQAVIASASELPELERVVDSPRSMVLVAWADLVDAIRGATLRSSIELPASTPAAFTLDALHSRGLVSSDLTTLVLDLQRLRDGVAHGSELPIPQSGARQYVESVRRVEAELRAIGTSN